MRFLRRLPGRKARSAAEEDDADVEREIARRLWSNHRLLPPTNRFHDRIRLVMYLLMLYVCFYVPMQVAFEIDYPVWQLAIDYVIDLLFIVDMFFMFRTTFYNSDQELVLDKKEIAQSYMDTRFYIDLLANIPWELCTLGEGGYNTTLFKGLRMLRFLRIARIWKLHHVPGEKRMSQLQRVRATLAWFLFSTHLIGCAWWGIGVAEYREAVAQGSDDMAARTWLQRPNYKSKLLDDDSAAHFWQNYFSSFYWGITIMMKTNWIPPTTAGELLFSAVVCLIGAIMFAVILGQINLLIRKFDESSALRREKIQLFRTFCENNGISALVSKKLVSYADAEWNSTGGVNTMNALKQLPSNLRSEVVLEMYKDFIPPSPMLSALSKPCVVGLLLNSTTQVCMKKENLVTFNEIAKEVFMLMSGALEVSIPSHLRGAAPANRGSVMPSASKADRISRYSKAADSKKMRAVRILERPGTIIGVWNAFDRTCRYPFEVKSTVQTTLLNISRQALAGVMSEYVSDADALSGVLLREHTLTMDALKLTKNKKVDTEQKLAPIADTGSAVPATLKQVSLSLEKLENRTNDALQEVGKTGQQAALLPVLLSQLKESGAQGVHLPMVAEPSATQQARRTGPSRAERQQQQRMQDRSANRQLDAKASIEANTASSDNTGALAAMVM